MTEIIPLAIRHRARWCNRPILIAGLLAATAFAAEAQRRPDSATYRPRDAATDSLQARCSRAQQQITRDIALRDSATLPAIRFLARCPSVAGTLLPALWRSAEQHADSAYLQSLLVPSSEIHDQRVAEALFTIAADTSAPILVRRASMVTLASYVRPRFVQPSVAASRMPGERWEVHIVMVDHLSIRDGSEPLESGTDARVRSLLGQIAASQPRTRTTLLARSLVDIIDQSTLDRSTPSFADSSAAYIVAAAGSEIQNTMFLVRILRQANDTLRQLKLDEIADDLTSRTLEARAQSDTATYKAA